ncbi:MAG: hypothetical protein XD78_2037 [Desulfotomaculum sp. 46_296]|nr:MAG: hypothetical protein XD78_2037 [Desulfotomaculum sp. 46_296]HAU31375.1 hypothetical protein [Desulfotomaculum sp.]
MKEAGNHKEIWFNDMKNKGLKIKLVHNENGLLAVINPVHKKQIWTGPPPSHEKIRGIIEKRVKRLKN